MRPPVLVRTLDFNHKNRPFFGIYLIKNWEMKNVLWFSLSSFLLRQFSGGLDRGCKCVFVRTSHETQNIPANGNQFSWVVCMRMRSHSTSHHFHLINFWSGITSTTTTAAAAPIVIIASYIYNILPSFSLWFMFSPNVLNMVVVLLRSFYCFDGIEGKKRKSWVMPSEKREREENKIIYAEVQLLWFAW